MAELPVPTVLSLPAVSVSPSVKCLQFSQDSQAILLTKYAVYILTPDTGVSVELSSIIQQTSYSKHPSSRSSTRVGWLRTMVEFDRSLAHQWPIDCAEWGAVSLGSLDPSLHAVTVSPSNLTAEAGCVLALLNSNLELTIWGPSKNPLTGQWIRLQDITSDLKTASAAKNAASAFGQTLRLQSTCIDWSSQPDWNLAHTPLIDASLLAVGNRAGTVTFLRYVKPHRQMVAVEEVVVYDRWVTSLAWSAWSSSHDGTGTCEAMLSCGTSDGSVVILTVRQTLSTKPSLTQFAPDREVSLTIEEHGERPSDKDGRVITGMRWVNLQGRSPILISHKSGVICLWSATSAVNVWSGSRTFVLRMQKRSVGSSAFSPASGICYVPSRDLAVVSLSDGSFHVIHKLSTSPSLEPPLSELIQADGLSAISRSVFVRAEPEKVTLKDVDRINGMTTYDCCNTFMWIYEATRPSDFSYKHDAKHVCTFVVAQLWDEDLDERVIFDLAERVGQTKSVSGETPISVLRPIFLHLRDPNRFARLQLRILDILRQLPSSGASVDVVIPSYTGDWTTLASRELRTSLTAHLFGWDSIQSQRIRYAIAAFCQNRVETPEVQQKFADAASLFLANLRAHVQLVLMRHLSAISGFLHRDSHDIFFARRTIHQAATTPAMAPALEKEAEELLAQLPPVPSHPDTSNASSGARADAGDPAAASSSASSMCEPCPACHTAIPLEPPGAESAICANGHVWARCCVTSFLLATPMVRTCIGCSRKALLPPSTSGPGPAPVVSDMSPGGDEHALRRGCGDHDRVVGNPQALPVHVARASSGGTTPGGLPSPAEGFSFVQDLLEATRRCPFCGNNFVVLV